MESTKMIGSSRSITELNRVETRSSKRKREASAEDPKAKEQHSEAQKKESTGSSRSNRVETRSFKRKRESSPEHLKAAASTDSLYEKFVKAHSRKKNSNAPSSNAKFQRAWGGRHAPRMPNPKDLAAYNKALKKNEFFDIPVSTSGYLVNAIRPVRDIKDPLIFVLAEFAIKAYNEFWKDNPEYTVLEIEKANMFYQRCLIFYITFKAACCANKDHPVSFQAEVLNDYSDKEIEVLMVRQSGDKAAPTIERVFKDDEYIRLPYVF